MLESLDRHDIYLEIAYQPPAISFREIEWSEGFHFSDDEMRDSPGMLSSRPIITGRGVLHCLASFMDKIRCGTCVFYHSATGPNGEKSHTFKFIWMFIRLTYPFLLE